MLITEVYQSQIIRKSTRSYLNCKNPKFQIWSTEDWHNRRSPSSCLSHIKTRALWIKKRSDTVRESVMSLSGLYFLSGAQSDKWWPAVLQRWATRDTEVEKFTVTGLEGPERRNGEVKAECREREVGPGTHASTRVSAWSGLLFSGSINSTCERRLLVSSTVGSYRRGTQEEGTGRQARLLIMRAVE